ncbi:MAG: hypothetical protein ACTHLH_01835 [Solirubrobacterales bacterium]
MNVTYSCAEEFTLRSSNGYKITVSADPEGTYNSVELTVEGHSGTALYIAQGHATASTIRARFGRLGRVAVRFEPSGRQRHAKLSKKCFRDRPPVVSSRLGSFVGTIRFRGERGYTRVSAHRAWGGIGDPLTNTSKKSGCDFHESKAQRKRELESVILDAASPRAGITFTAGRLFGSPPPLSPSGKSAPSGNNRILFLAGAGEKIGRLRILRFAVAFGGPETFAFDEALDSATVSPPAPFTGSGSFLRNPDGSTSWTGTLAVSLPGLGSVPLTGGKAELATVATQMKQLEEESEIHR